MISDTDDDIFATFDKVFRDEPALQKAVKPKNRKAAEKRIGLRHDDKRRLRATGRTAQFNLKIRPEYKERITEASKQHGILIAELAERGFELILQELAANKSKKK